MSGMLRRFGTVCVEGRDGQQYREEVHCYIRTVISRPLTDIVSSLVVTVQHGYLSPVYHIIRQDARLACYCEVDKRTTEYDVIELNTPSRQ